MKKIFAILLLTHFKIHAISCVDFSGTYFFSYTNGHTFTSIIKQDSCRSISEFDFNDNIESTLVPSIFHVTNTTLPFNRHDGINVELRSSSYTARFIDNKFEVTEYFNIKGESWNTQQHSFTWSYELNTNGNLVYTTNADNFESPIGIRVTR